MSNTLDGIVDSIVGSYNKDLGIGIKESPKPNDFNENYHFAYGCGTVAQLIGGIFLMPVYGAGLPLIANAISNATSSKSLFYHIHSLMDKKGKPENKG